MNYFFQKLVTISCILLILQSCDDGSAARPINLTNSADNFKPAATEDIVMYEINPNAFSSTKNIEGIINRLDNIKALGINTIWIMPIYPIGTLNSIGSPYCVEDYTSVNPNLGTLQDLQKLVTEAHKRNIAVILDWVANHTSWDNSWITEHPDWYTQDGNGQIISPAGTTWTDVADLNYDNADMRLAMIENMKYWVTNTNIDGFRCDAADYVPYDFWLQANTALKAIPNKNLILLAEGSRADHFAAGFQMNFSWDYLTSLKSIFGTNQSSVGNLFTTNSSEYAVVPAGSQKLRFTTNHDESNLATPISVYGGNDGAVAASVITTFMQGVPLLYCGQEVGVSDVATYNGTNIIDWTANSDMLLAYQKLLGFYNYSATARKGTLTTYPDSDIAVFEKSSTTDQVLVIVNSRSTAQNLVVPTDLQGNWTNALTNDAVTLSETMPLTGFQYLILTKLL